MKKLLMLIPLLFIVLLVGCSKKEVLIDVKVIDYHTQIVIEEKTKKEKQYLVVVDIESNTYYLEVKKDLFSKIENTYPLESILSVSEKELIKVIK